MKKALIVNGVYGTPKENWFPFNKAAGYIKFKLLLDTIKEIYG